MSVLGGLINPMDFAKAAVDNMVRDDPAGQQFVASASKVEHVVEAAAPVAVAVSAIEKAGRGV